MPTTAEEAQRRLETLPSTLRATFVGVLMGIGISIVSELALKPIIVNPNAYGNYTVYLGGSQTSTISPVGYYLILSVAMAGIIIFSFLVYKKVIGLSGVTVNTISHGIDAAGLEAYVARLDKYLEEKLTMYGYDWTKHQNEDGNFVRGVFSKKEDVDLVTVKIKQFELTVESEIDPTSNRAALDAIKWINEMQSKKRDSAAIF